MSVICRVPINFFVFKGIPPPLNAYQSALCFILQRCLAPPFYAHRTGCSEGVSFITFCSHKSRNIVRRSPAALLLPTPRSRTKSLPIPSPSHPFPPHKPFTKRPSRQPLRAVRHISHPSRGTFQWNRSPYFKVSHILVFTCQVSTVRCHQIVGMGT